MKNSLKITAMVALLFFAATSVSNAQYFRRTNNRMTYAGQCLDIPGLTEVQKTQINEYNAAHQKVIDQMREEFYAAPDLVAANEIKAKMTLEQNNHLEKISKILTEEQRVYFNENIVAGPAGGGGRAYNRAPRGGRGYANWGGGRGRNRVDRPGRGRGGAGYGWRY